MTCVRLERALSLHANPFAFRLTLKAARAESRAEERTEYVSERVLRVSTRRAFVLPSRLLQLSQTTADGMCVWSLPKVFHTCGKNCGNSTRSVARLSFNPRFMGVSDVAKVKSRGKSGLPRV